MLPPSFLFDMRLSEAKDCQLCPLWKSRTHIIFGEGNPDADIFMIAQAPGAQEDIDNRMFTGPTGEVFWDLLAQANGQRNLHYITNLLKCTLPQNRRPKQADIQACSRYLERELELVQPSIVLPLGYYATKYIFETRGLPFFNREEYSSLLGKAFVSSEFIVIPLTHPSTLIHNPQFWGQAVQRYRRAFELNPCRWFLSCPMRTFTISGLLDYCWTDHYCLGDWQSCQRFRKETEGMPHSDYLLPDGSYLKIKK